MDKLDRQILSILEENSRISFAELANEVGLSKTPCWNRVKELQKKGVIEGFDTRLNSQLLGLHIKAMVSVVVNFAFYNDFEQAMTSHKNVLTCSAVTGDFDYVLTVIASDITTLDDVLRKELSSVPGVERFSTAIVTRTIKERSKLLDLV